MRASACARLRQHTGSIRPVAVARLPRAWSYSGLHPCHYPRLPSARVRRVLAAAPTADGPAQPQIIQIWRLVISFSDISMGSLSGPIIRAGPRLSWGMGPESARGPA